MPTQGLQLSRRSSRSTPATASGTSATPRTAASELRLGVDSLTYTLALRWQTAHDPSIPPVMAALAGDRAALPGPVHRLVVRVLERRARVGRDRGPCASTQVTGDPKALAKAEAAFAFVEGSDVYALGACPDIRYQQPFGAAATT